MSEKKYRNHDENFICDGGIDFYASHVSAMTSENLYSKSDIVAELAWRDYKIAEAERERDQALDLLKVAQCPECDNSGGIPRQVGDHEWEWKLCRFCYERDGLLTNRTTDKE